MAESRERTGESEKITVNLGYVDLGRIDLLVRDGFYANRTDFIRTAIRDQLRVQGDEIKGAIARRKLDLGLVRISRGDLDDLKAVGRTVDINVVGLAVIADDVTPDLARDTIRSVTVLGLLQASSAVRAALADRIG